MESIFNGVFQIYLFAWTPILQASVFDGDINIGIIYLCFVLNIIAGTIIYEVNIYLETDICYMSEDKLLQMLNQYTNFRSNMLVVYLP